MTLTITSQHSPTWGLGALSVLLVLLLLLAEEVLLLVTVGPVLVHCCSSMSCFACMLD